MKNELIEGYDKYIVAFSGGKDSIACFLSLLESGVPKSKIELWHHLIDGPGETFMDWPVTEDYCRKFAQAFGVPIYFSWKERGFKGEMLRDNSPTAPTFFETPNGVFHSGGKGPNGTRLKFPQISSNLSVRWCSAYLKIDVCSAAIRNQSRFNGMKTALISGERAQESTARAKYKVFEPDRADNRDGKNKRHVDRIRLVHGHSEAEVWEIIKRHGVVVHPCYYMGWSRCSCLFCIFGNADQFASAKLVSPLKAKELVTHEKSFGVTLKRDKPISIVMDSGKVYAAITPELLEMSRSTEYTGEIFTQNWKLPAGAFGESCGPN